MKFREIEHFIETQAYHTIGGFYAPIKVNVTNVLYNTTFLAYTLSKNKHLKILQVHQLKKFLHFILKTTFESCNKLFLREKDIFYRRFDRQLKPILSLLLLVN